MRRNIIMWLLTFMALVFTEVQGQIYTGCDHDEVLKSHPIFCNQFLQCSNGYLYEMKCSSDLVFNEDKQYCDWKHNVERCYGLSTSESVVTTAVTPEVTTPEITTLETTTVTTGGTTTDEVTTEVTTEVITTEKITPEVTTTDEVTTELTTSENVTPEVTTTIEVTTTDKVTTEVTTEVTTPEVTTTEENCDWYQYDFETENYSFQDKINDQARARPTKSC